jgi:hypothetical protein
VLMFVDSEESEIFRRCLLCGVAYRKGMLHGLASGRKGKEGEW